MTSRRGLWWVGFCLWLLAPALLALSLWRPVHRQHTRAGKVPQRVGAFRVVRDAPITDNFVRLLGTRDVAWRTYENDEQKRIFVVAVFHDQNWKSLHPPHICIRGTNFSILQDRTIDVPLADDSIEVGRLLASRRVTAGGKTYEQSYLSLYAFAGADFVTPSYTGFFLRHAPRALMRNATPGFLLRVETFVHNESPEAAEARCQTFLAEMLPACRKLIGEPNE